MQEVSSRKLVAEHQRSEELPGTSGLRKRVSFFYFPSALQARMVCERCGRLVPRSTDEWAA